MAHTRSSNKRIEIAERNRLRNQFYKSTVRTVSKKSVLAAETYGKQPSPEALELAKQKLSEAYSKIDKAVVKGILHKNTGARKKARLARNFKKLVVSTEVSAT
ncbi:MAG: 30S ribosomal protein S20 [Coleofasciculaceae cyanobacterium SM2_1_6]|nr:30S ribosomal protein S20 [Coleofasciculaceae cyanobacterium SM2_1_6]